MPPWWGTAVGTVVLSPHPDDAALSVGAALASSLLPKPVTVVTVFDRSTFSSASIGDVDHVTALRAREDESYCASAQAGFQRLGLADACVRFPERPISALFGPLPAEPHVVACLARALDDLRPTRQGYLLVAPMAIGGHVDHRLVAAAACSARWPLKAFYADQPYAAELATVPPEGSVTLRAGVEELAAKLRAAAHYPSQPAAGRLGQALGSLPADLPCEWLARRPEVPERP